MCVSETGNRLLYASVLSSRVLVLSIWLLPAYTMPVIKHWYWNHSDSKTCRFIAASIDGNEKSL